jgi:hypothetical protein
MNMKHGYLVKSIGMALLSLSFSGCKKDSTPPPGAIQNNDTHSKTAMVMVPGVGMDNIRFGITVEEMKKLLGEPERTLGGAFEYPSQGFAVLRSARDKRVAAILCGNQTKDSPLIRACRVRTDKGIGMGSTENQIRAAYGPPAATTNVQGITVLKYPALPAEFALIEGKVVHMTFTRKR